MKSNVSIILLLFCNICFGMISIFKREPQLTLANLTANLINLKLGRNYSWFFYYLHDDVLNTLIYLNPEV